MDLIEEGYSFSEVSREMGIVIILISAYGIYFKKNTIVPVTLVVVFICIKMAVGYKKYEKI